MSISRRRAAWLALAAAASLAAAYLGVILLAPEVGGHPGSGPALLSSAEAGYRKGDVVWLSTSVEGLAPGDVVLYDWAKATGWSGWGPTLVLAQVVAAGGDTVTFRGPLGGVTVRERTTKGGIYSDLLERNGLGAQGVFRLDEDVLLLLANKGIIPVRRRFIRARVCFKLGYDPFRARRLRNRAY